jgi:diguanylate cyclase (GGDEF)-like protein
VPSIEGNPWVLAKTIHNTHDGAEARLPQRSVWAYTVSMVFTPAPKRKLSVLVAAAAVASVPALGLADWLTGPEWGFSIFYLIPIAAATWYAGRRAGLFVSVLSAVAWFLADLYSGHRYSHPLIPYWNSLIRAGFFVTTTLALAALRRALESERRSSLSDYLTGVGNFRMFENLATLEISRSRRNGKPISVAYLDLDDFKAVNDSLGHKAGDSLLAEVATVLKASVRASDLVVRLGGDEFAVLMPETEQQGAEEVLRRIQAGLGQIGGQRTWPVHASIGLATFLEPPADTQGFLKATDHLMYQAKQDGKNRVARRVVERGELSGARSPTSVDWQRRNGEP